MSLRDLFTKTIDEGIRSGLIQPGGRIKQQLIDELLESTQKYSAGTMSLENTIDIDKIENIE